MPLLVSQFNIKAAKASSFSETTSVKKMTLLLRDVQQETDCKLTPLTEQSLKYTMAVREIKMYHQSVTILPGLLRRCSLFDCFSEDRLDCP